MQPMAPEEVAVPVRRLACTQVATLALLHEAHEPAPHVRVELVELLRGVPGAEVVAPAAQHQVQVGDDDSHVLHSVSVATGHLLHARAHPLHVACRRTTLEEEDPTTFPLPDRPRHALAQVAPEKVEALDAA